MRAGLCLLPSQKKLIELQSGKKSLEDQVEMLRTLKEEAEKPEKEAKDQHRKLWEGMSLCPGVAVTSPWLLAGNGLGPGVSCSLSLVCRCTEFLKSRHFSSPGASLSSTVCWPLCLKVVYSSNLQL